MFVSKNSYITVIDAKEELHSENISLKKQIGKLTKERDALRKPLDEHEIESRDAPVVIDWGNLDAFSVERVTRQDKSKTIIGYWRKNSDDAEKPGEWGIECNSEHHETLVKQFTEYMKNKS